MYNINTQIKDNDMWEWIITLSIIFGVVLFKITHPHVRWRCLIGVHEYHYSYERHGMHLCKDAHNVVGTKRRIYKCSCGFQKPAENKDYI